MSSIPSHPLFSNSIFVDLTKEEQEIVDLTVEPAIKVVTVIDLTGSTDESSSSSSALFSDSFCGSSVGDVTESDDPTWYPWDN